MSHKDLPTVSSIDLHKYTGTWYEIAKFPNGFEKGLECITATYSLRKDGKIRVENKGHRIADPSKTKTSIGKAWVPDPNFPARLKVQFFWPFAGDYYVIELDKLYQYALIGEPSRKYLWILSRSKNMDNTLYLKLVDMAKSLGFDVSRITMTAQVCEP